MLRREIDLILVVASSLALAAVLLTVPSAAPARVALGLPFILLFPGYCLMAAVFPRKADLDAVARIALGIGLSLAIVPLIALALNYSSWGIRLHPMLAFVTLFIVLASALAVYRRRSLPKEEAFGLTFGSRLLRQPGARGASRALALTGVLSLTALGIVGYFVATSSGEGEAFTEFYVLGPGGRAEGYPEEVVLGESAPVTLGLVNHEGRDIAYGIALRIDGRTSNRIRGLVLADGDQWERRVSLVPFSAGGNQKVEFLLYRDGVSEPYRRLHLWLDVERARPEAFVAEARPSPTPTPAPTPPPPAEALSEEQAPAPVEEPPQPEVHIVVAGEYLTLIAGLYEVPLEDIVAANDVPDPDLIYPQQQILIPAGGAGESE